MKNIIGIILIGVTAIFGTVLQTQKSFTFSVAVKAPVYGFENDTVFLAGNFNNWSPSATPMQFDAKDSLWHVSLKGISGNQQFKFTRGSWDKVQTTDGGKDLGNYNIDLKSDTAVFYQVVGWKDVFSPGGKQHTASPQVKRLDKVFHIVDLNTNKRIWVYLPPGYTKATTLRYPVLYMHDGQNLFDDFTAFSGEWGIDEAMDSLIKAKVKPSIIVGIDNGPKRLNEYNPYSNERFGEGLGEAYTNFIINDLKPYIDSAYRTLPTKENTAIAGSSMGGLISYYAALTHPEVFGSAGIFSPSFWIAPEVKSLTDSLAGGLRTKMFFSIGREEGEDYVNDMQDVMDRFAANSKGIAYAYFQEAGRHNEESWHKAFPKFYKWIMASGANVVLNVKN